MSQTQMQPECGARIGKGVVTYPCFLPKDHEGPCAARENAASLNTRGKWEAGQQAKLVMAATQQEPMTFRERSEPGTSMPHPAVLKEQTQQQSEKRDGCPNCGSVNLSTVATGAPNGLLMNCQDCDHFFRADAPDVQYPNPAMSQPSTELPPLMVMNTSDESVSIVSCPVCGSDQVMIDSRERDDATRLGCMDCDARWFVRHPDDDSDVEPTKQRPGDQPLPVTNDHPFVADALCSFIEARKQVGIERYGTPLQPNNGRDAIRDAFEEAVDLATYLAQVIIERDGSL